MEEQSIMEIIKAGWPYLACAGGIATIFGITRLVQRRNSGNPDYQNQTNASKVKRLEEEVEEEQIPTKDISHLLSQEIDGEGYRLKATVEKVHPTGGGYAGILSDEHTKMLFYYENYGGHLDDIAGVLLHESRDNQSELELNGEVESSFDDETSKILRVNSVRGKIDGRDYNTDEDC